MKGLVFLPACVCVVSIGLPCNLPCPWPPSLHSHLSSIWSRALPALLPSREQRSSAASDPPAAAWRVSVLAEQCLTVLSAKEQQKQEKDCCSLLVIIMDGTFQHRLSVNVRKAHFCLVFPYLFSTLLRIQERATPTCNLYIICRYV